MVVKVFCDWCGSEAHLDTVDVNAKYEESGQRYDICSKCKDGFDKWIKEKQKAAKGIK